MSKKASTGTVPVTKEEIKQLIKDAFPKNRGKKKKRGRVKRAAKKLRKASKKAINAYYGMFGL